VQIVYRVTISSTVKLVYRGDQRCLGVGLATQSVREHFAAETNQNLLRIGGIFFVTRHCMLYEPDENDGIGCDWRRGGLTQTTIICSAFTLRMRSTTTQERKIVQTLLFVRYNLPALCVLGYILLLLYIWQDKKSAIYKQAAKSFIACCPMPWLWAHGKQKCSMEAIIWLCGRRLFLSTTRSSTAHIPSITRRQA
jgi:hypothetical protein